MAFNLWFFSQLFTLTALLTFGKCQKLLLVMTESFPGSIYHKYAHLEPFKFIEKEGCWSDLLYPVFPSLSLPNQYSLLTGKLPNNHGITADYMYDSSTKNYFTSGSKKSDYDLIWWNKTEPIWVTAKKERASVAAYFWPFICQLKFGVKLDICIPFNRNSPNMTLNLSNIDTVLKSTRDHDFVLAYHNSVAHDIAKYGPSKLCSLANNSINEFSGLLQKIIQEARSRFDLNVIVMSDHGASDVPAYNKRFMDDYIPLEWIQMTLGAGAVKQIIPIEGKSYEIFDTLRRTGSIPNVKVYYTTPRMTDLPKWYKYTESNRIPELILVAQPGYAILTKNVTKQIPTPSSNDWKAGMSGYNNNFPDTLGVFFAYGPSFKKSVKRDTCRLLDVHSLICHILGLSSCQKGDGNFSRNDDILLKSNSFIVKYSFVVFFVCAIISVCVN